MYRTVIQYSQKPVVLCNIRHCSSVSDVIRMHIQQWYSTFFFSFVRGDGKGTELVSGETVPADQEKVNDDLFFG
jgi:hypothetical protein